MKRKAQPKPDATPEVAVVVAPAVAPVVEQVVYAATERAFTRVPCIVCGSETRSDLVERLCWVCRRLKISAWRDSEPMPAQE